MSKMHYLETNDAKTLEWDRMDGLRLWNNPDYDWSACRRAIPIENITDDEDEVTCKNCLRVMNKEKK